MKLKTDSDTYEQVVAVKHSMQPCVRVTVSHGDQYSLPQESITVSTSHEFVSPREGAPPIRASELRIGQMLRMEGNKSSIVVGLVYVGVKHVVQISLEGPTHLYLSSGFVHHNKEDIPDLTEGQHLRMQQLMRQLGISTPLPAARRVTGGPIAADTI